MRRSWHEPLDDRKIPLAGVYTALVATGINVGLRFASQRWIDVDTGQPTLSLTVVIATSCGSVCLACLILAFLGHTQARPFTIFRRLAVIAFLLASAASALACLGWLPGMQTISYDTLLFLAGMNAVTAVSCVAFLTTVPRDRDVHEGH